MAEDDLDIFDIEQAILTGRLTRIEKNDPRGNKYVIEGSAMDGKTAVGVVGRFATTDRYLIITVFAITINLSMKDRNSSANMGDVLRVLEDIQNAGVIERYAIGGAIASILLYEPISTIDLSIF